MARISVLVITYDRPGDLLELLESVRSQEGIPELLEEVLVFDNASTADYGEIRSFVDAHPGLGVKLTRSETNLGAVRARNKMMAAARGDLLLVLDDDAVIAGTSALKELSTVFDSDLFESANTGIVALRVIYHDTGEVQRSAFPHKKYTRYAGKSEFLTSYYIGCAHLIKREVVEQAGLYPENFFYGMEEYDLSYRVLEAGYSIGYCSAVTIEHKESPLGRQPSFQKVRMQWVNKSEVAWRYLPARYFVSTAILWSFNYVRRVRGHPGVYVRGWLEIVRIPFREKGRPVGKRVLAYLDQVEARLWY